MSAVASLSLGSCYQREFFGCVDVPIDHFPESRFAVAEEHLVSYRNTLRRGYRAMKRQRVVIAGLARNVGKLFPRTQARLERLGNLFGDHRFVLYENDSIDRTLPQLLNWQQHNHRVRVLAERLGDPVHPGTSCLNRAERMAYYRRQYWQYIAAQFADFDAVIVVDTDLEGGWSYEGVANTFGHRGWDAVGSNGIVYKRRVMDVNHRIQYDAWAFRHEGSFESVPIREVNAMQWQRGETLQPVNSCFGGLACYRMPAFLAAQYAGGDCEHIALHRSMRSAGFGRCFLNPSQITLYGRRTRRLDPFARCATTVLQRVLPARYTRWM